jgi:hypothetical protein
MLNQSLISFDFNSSAKQKTFSQIIPFELVEHVVDIRLNEVFQSAI